MSTNEGGYHQEDDDYAGAGKEKKGRPNTIWVDNIREDMNEYNVIEDMAISRSVWNIEIKAGQLLPKVGK